MASFCDIFIKNDAIRKQNCIDAFALQVWIPPATFKKPNQTHPTFHAPTPQKKPKP